MHLPAGLAARFTEFELVSAVNFRIFEIQGKSSGKPTRNLLGESVRESEAGREGEFPSAIATTRTTYEALQIVGIGTALLSTHAAIYNVFNIQRHLISCRTLRVFGDQAMLTWRQATVAA